LAQSVDFGTSALWSLLGEQRTCQQQANVANDPKPDLGQHFILQ
jgi:hypothetical protein